ncbi:RsmB/NOP family class I SAM-dependent RNA methyltransferase [Stagnihabitans tardus]|uniref:RsmB/NOP family class I SAM-dependent RNA methyltransferase n=1 Tax=Stagnihabitans tardus TaxID=2699202 RepID=A0AAE4Y7V2_9RHOB|nr:RsmB/NOP family class I SAM-dependent RNA methyltransferase [Stagnihabitans tardus]NBZ87496.1 RsmB/NOP family class I SAM-dependent RNA methyltransferase [Stagnihabitans tardus]
MTPAARVSAAIEILDRILAGEAPEPALTNWGRAHRFAGSGDRHAIRDHVFDALRRRASWAALGGSLTGRGLMLGWAREAGVLAQVFTDAPHAPGAAVSPPRAPSETEALDCPDWLAPRLRADLGAAFVPTCQALQHRAPVFLRVNLARTTRAAAALHLQEEGIATREALVASALEVTAGARKVQASQAYAQGLVELQDAASQAVVAELGALKGLRVLDLCAGGGGKALAMAALGAEVTAHDAAPRRMADLPLRAARAGARIALTDAPERLAPFDLVLADVPCSGSGSWRRDPMGKWSLTEAKLAATLALQAQILDRAFGMVAPGGVLAYATCSILAAENGVQVDAAMQRHGLVELGRRQFLPGTEGDGLFIARMKRV